MLSNSHFHVYYLIESSWQAWEGQPQGSYESKKVFCLKPSEYPMLLPKANPRDMLPKYLSAYPIDIATQHASETKVTQDETQQGKKFTDPPVIWPLTQYLRVSQGHCMPKELES